MKTGWRGPTAGAVLGMVFLLGGAPAGSAQRDVVVEDPAGAAARVGAPVSAEVALSAAQMRAAVAGRLALREKGMRGAALIPAQLEPRPVGDGMSRLWWRMPPGPAGRRTFALTALRKAAGTPMLAGRESVGRLRLSEEGRPVLGYNYHTVEPGALLDSIAPANLIYARARSDYIHPLYGPDGEELTRDWPVDHPHHRGIYWAWPEVDYRGERGDLHALQRVFARPVGQYSLRSGPVYAEIEALSEWRWEDREPIVREQAFLRAYRATPGGRCVDLRFVFTALGDEVALARRGTNLYGGLNIRLSPVQGQQISFHTDPEGSQPRMAWATLSGTFAGGRQPVALTVFQKPTNPAYPGDWVQYPELNWFQPTFPAAGTRHVLRRGEPLVLEYRLWTRPASGAPDAECADQWRAFSFASSTMATMFSSGVSLPT